MASGEVAQGKGFLLLLKLLLELKQCINDNLNKDA